MGRFSKERSDTDRFDGNAGFPPIRVVIDIPSLDRYVDYRRGEDAKVYLETIKKLERKNMKLETLVSKLTATVTNAEKIAAEKEAARIKLEQDEIVEDRETADRNASYDSTIDDLKKQKAALEKKVADLEANQQEVPQEMSDAIEALNTRIANLPGLKEEPSPDPVPTPDPTAPSDGSTNEPSDPVSTGSQG